jgi:hypothetical protein
VRHKTGDLPGGSLGAGDRSRARDDEVLPQGFGGIDSGLQRSAGAIARSNRCGAVPRSSLRVWFCLDGHALVWRSKDDG